MADVLSRQYADWFGLVGVSPDIDAGICWERLGIMPEYIAPCDMLMLIPTRLATELNGSGGLLCVMCRPLSSSMVDSTASNGRQAIMSAVYGMALTR